MAGDIPACPRGHPDGRVVRDGLQKDGGRPRQRWRCTLPGGSYHRFLGVVSRTRADHETCVECESHLAPYEGPAAPAQFEYLIREIAGALVDIGRGSTYIDAARRVRLQASGNTPGKQPRLAHNGQTVADWVADFVPVVAAAHAPAGWPAILVLDSKTFWWHAAGAFKNRTALYTILAAYGYDHDGKNGRLWRLEAHPVRNADAWAGFLDLFPGTPLSIVADEDPGIRAAIINRWGSTFWLERYHACEHHLYANGRATLERTAGSGALLDLFHGALTDIHRWDAFETAVQESGLRAIQTWVRGHSQQIRRQAGRRELIAPIYTNGALESVFARVKKCIGDRALSFRNRARLNLLLELMRLRELRADNAGDYAIAIRAHLEAHRGHPQRRYREICDRRANPDGMKAKNSLWSPAAQLRLQARFAARAAAKQCTADGPSATKPAGSISLES